MNGESTLNLIQGTVTVSLLGGLGGGVYSAIKRQPPLILGGAAALNSGISGFVFFGTREYLAKPCVHALRSRASHSPGLESPPQSSVWQTRMDGVPESIVAGSLTGGFLNAWKHGPKALISGTLTWAFITGLVHISFNELRLARIKYVSRRLYDEPGAQVSDPHVSSSYPSHQASTRIMDIMTWVAPVKKLSDEEYLEIMKRKQDEVDRRIKQLDQELSRGRQRRDDAGSEQSRQG